MKKNNNRLRWSIILALFFAVTLTVQAAGVTVDSFTSGEQNLLVRCTIAPECVADPVGPSVSSVTPAAIGGERDAKLNWVFGTRNNVATLDVNPSSGHLIFQQDALAKARAEVVWDGPDGNPLAIDTSGLGADLVDGTNSGLELTVYSSLVSNTPDIVLTVTLYAGDTSASQNINISDSITPPGRSFFLPFTAFPTIDPTDVGAISLVIAPGTKGDDITISSLTAVPSTDWGDLPEAYAAITVGINGARHTVGNRFLGQVIDRDAGGQPNPLAQGDDSGILALDDEDGIVVPSGPSNTFGDGSAEMVYTVSGASGCLVGWIDWNDERILLMPRYLGEPANW